jgi:DNA-binding MarR family transcriptional regulator
MASNDPGTDGYPIGSVSRWPAAAIAAAWQRELPGVRTESIEIITPVWRIAKILADDRRRTLAALGIDSSTLDLLSVIRRSGPPYALTTREITRRTLITPGAVSQRVDRAEQAGLVERAPSSASRRAVSVRLTDTGHALIETTARQLLDHEADLVSALTTAERTVLAGVLARLEQALTQLSGNNCRYPLPGPAVPTGCARKEASKSWFRFADVVGILSGSAGRRGLVR